MEHSILMNLFISLILVFCSLDRFVHLEIIPPEIPEIVPEVCDSAMQQTCIIEFLDRGLCSKTVENCLKFLKFRTCDMYYLKCTESHGSASPRVNPNCGLFLNCINQVYDKSCRLITICQNLSMKHVKLWLFEVCKVALSYCNPMV